METSEPIPIPRRPGGGGEREKPAQVAFQRAELNHILKVYGRMVAAGRWRDYAIGHAADMAEFAVYRRASEMPLFRIVKIPALRLKQGQYALIGLGGQILKRGHSLPQVLKFFDRRRFDVVD